MNQQDQRFTAYQHRSPLLTTLSAAILLIGGILVGTVAPATAAPASVPASTTAQMSPAADQANNWRWKQLSNGWYHTCGVTTAGAAYCWGSNNQGQLGTGDTTDSNTPQPVKGLESGVASIDAGYKHNCAVTTTGQVKCWGTNSAGELGDSTTTNSKVPVAVKDLPAAKAVSAGSAATCAITTNDALKCWGSNDTQQLGALFDGHNSTKPVDVWGMSSGVTQVDTDAGTACATTSAGVWCWGDNSWGQMGLGSYVKTLPIPVLNPELGTGSTYAAPTGRAMCATKDGNVLCSGQDAAGNIGNIKSGITNKLVAVSGMQNGDVSELAVGEQHVCSLNTKGAVSCWGSNQSGKLGNADPSNGSSTSQAQYNYTPVTPLGLDSGVKSISAGITHSCAILDDDSAKCWGHNFQGQLGVGHNQLMVNVPVPVGVTNAPVIPTSSFPDARQGVRYSHNLTATGGQAPLTWDIAAGSLPEGLSLDRATGVISGIPTKAGSSGVTVRVTGANGAVNWSTDRWIDQPLIDLKVLPANSHVPSVTKVEASNIAHFKAIRAHFNTIAGSTKYELKCTNAAGNASAGTSGSTNPLSVVWNRSEAATCRVRAQSSAGWSEWSAPSTPFSPASA